MQRILILGCAGSGKSTLARQLGERLQLEVIHLDSLFWNPGWQPSSTELLFSRVEAAIQGDRWVMDGNYSRTLPLRLAKADQLIYLDFPRWLCLLRVIRRSLSNYGKTRPDLGPDCPEKFDWEFLKWVWNYPRRSRPGTLKFLSEAPLPVKILRTSHEVKQFLTELNN